MIVLPLAILVAFWALNDSLHYQEELRRQTFTSQEARTAAQDVLTLLVDSETGVRGYVATGEPLFLEPHSKAVSALPAARRVMAQRLGGAPDQADLVAHLNDLVLERLAISRSEVEAQASGRSTRLAFATQERAGKAAMDEIRGVVTQLQLNEVRRLSLQTAEADRISHRVRLIMGGVIAALVLLLLMSARLMWADLKRRDKALELQSARSEVAEQANEAKSSFLAIMSHEIRTPLNGVLGMTQAMAADDLSAVQRERLDVIRQSGESLLAILNDVLDLSKIEAGKLDLEHAEFSMAELARGAHAAFTALANKKGVSFDLDVDPDAQGVYLGDSTRVRQILYNLISNGLKFTQRGEVRVRVASDPEGVRLVVSDTGIGIAADRLPHLFQKFEQADASTTRKFGGTGLGLAICRELAQLMNGHIDVESRPGQGSTFSVSLPLPRLRSESNAPAPAKAAARPQLAGAAGLRILAAEDNTINQLVLKTLLHQIGAEPLVVADGEQAVSAWLEAPWDIVLMDIQMPVLDGRAATREIRRLERETGRPRTPIIALTANAMAHQLLQYGEDGMDGALAKPIDVARLFGALNGVLQAKDDATTKDLQASGFAAADDR